jgi:signal transduction histidine kinase
MSDPTAGLYKPLEKFERTLGECFKILARKRDVRVGCENANRQTDECVITVAQQLQKSMNVIAGWLELLQCEKLNQQDARRAIRSMNRSVKRQVKLIEELLDVSQNSNGKTFV